jgi:hypothetical protein
LLTNSKVSATYTSRKTMMGNNAPSMGNDSLFYGDHKPFGLKQGGHYKAPCIVVAIVIKRLPFIH